MPPYTIKTIPTHILKIKSGRSKIIIVKQFIH
jgi:hypothetical protein